MTRQPPRLRKTWRELPGGEFAASGSAAAPRGRGVASVEWPGSISCRVNVAEQMKHEKQQTGSVIGASIRSRLGVVHPSYQDRLCAQMRKSVAPHAPCRINWTVRREKGLRRRKQVRQIC